jgi:hypothetical protein
VRVDDENVNRCAVPWFFFGGDSRRPEYNFTSLLPDQPSAAPSAGTVERCYPDDFQADGGYGSTRDYGPLAAGDNYTLAGDAAFLSGVVGVPDCAPEPCVGPPNEIGAVLAAFRHQTPKQLGCAARRPLHARRPSPPLLAPSSSRLPRHASSRLAATTR